MSETTDDDKPSQIEDALLDRMRDRLMEPVPPLTNDERKRLRLMLDNYEKSAWLQKRILTITPWLFAVIGGLVTAWQFVKGSK